MSVDSPPSDKGYPYGVICGLLKQTVSGSQKDNVPRLAAALAYYSIISVAPLLLIAIAIAGWAFGEEAARGQISEQVQGLIGKTGGKAIETLIKNANRPVAGVVATLLGALVLFFGAGGVFVELRDSLNTIWEVKSNPTEIIQSIIRERFLSLAMVLGVCFLLLVSLVVNAVMAMFVNCLGDMLPNAIRFGITTNVLPFVVATLVFALMFKNIPDTRVHWRDVWMGAVITSGLFTIGKSLIGLYLGWSGIDSTFGAAGSAVVFLIWVYYSAQVFFFGAEFTHVYSRHSKTRLESRAPGVTEEARGNQTVLTQQPSTDSRAGT